MVSSSRLVQIIFAIVLNVFGGLLIGAYSIPFTYVALLILILIIGIITLPFRISQQDRSESLQLVDGVGWGTPEDIVIIVSPITIFFAILVLSLILAKAIPYVEKKYVLSVIISMTISLIVAFGTFLNLPN